MRLQIITPEGVTFDGDVQSVVLPGVDGELGILPRHQALMTQLHAGEVRVTQGGQPLYLAVGEGFAEVSAESVAVLTDMAVAEKDIDEQAVEEARRRAEEALRAKTLIGEELEATQAVLARSLAQLHVKRRRRT